MLLMRDCVGHFLILGRLPGFSVARLWHPRVRTACYLAICLLVTSSSCQGYRPIVGLERHGVRFWDSGCHEGRQESPRIQMKESFALAAAEVWSVAMANSEGPGSGVDRQRSCEVCRAKDWVL